MTEITESSGRVTPLMFPNNEFSYPQGVKPKESTGESTQPCQKPVRRKSLELIYPGGLYRSRSFPLSLEDQKTFNRH